MLFKGIQWVVTTHSPLIISSFDRKELMILESNERGVVAEHKLNRDVIGFSADEIYRFLLKTSPYSTAATNKIAAAQTAMARGDLPEEDREKLALLVEYSPDVGEDEAKKRLSYRRNLNQRIKDSGRL